MAASFVGGRWRGSGSRIAAGGPRVERRCCVDQNYIVDQRYMVDQQLAKN
jgi:hypothetical protein